MIIKKSATSSPAPKVWYSPHSYKPITKSTPISKTTTISSTPSLLPNSMIFIKPEKPLKRHAQASDQQHQKKHISYTFYNPSPPAFTTFQHPLSDYITHPY